MSVKRVAIEEAIYKLPMIIGMPIITERITFPMVATTTIDIATIMFIRFPRGKKLISGSENAISSVIGISRRPDTTMEEFPKMTATSSPIYVTPIPGNLLFIKSLKPSENGIRPCVMFYKTFLRYVSRARPIASSRSAVSSILSLPTFANHILNSSAFGDGID